MAWRFWLQPLASQTLDPAPSLRVAIAIYQAVSDRDNPLLSFNV
jgi:hypothetical protein